MEEIALPKLRVSRKEANEKIHVRIEEGKLLRNMQILSGSQLYEVGIKSNHWSNYNRDLLLKLFDNFSLAHNYETFQYDSSYFHDLEQRDNADLPTDLQYRVSEYQQYMDFSIDSLEDICSRLELFDEVLDNPTRTFGDHVFIVHGQDEAAKHAIARFVEKFNLKATILDEQASKGQTIIDKFEEYADKAGFAIVLLTPDDIGAPKDKQGGLKDRARQNVILELGYFLHKLGRKRVRVLHKKEVELPSDIHGIVYVPMNNPNDWQLKLAKEMKQVGLPVDLNKLAEK